ncbi:MAG: hypothetical protein HYR95_00930 [Candidatus Colwellbacteria bacterium]|nr:hypothetical protein [Candidatus Colwellbacteria bacterium]
MRRFLVILMFIVASSGAVFLLNKDRSFELAAVNVGYDKTVFELPGIPEATRPRRIRKL